MHAYIKLNAIYWANFRLNYLRFKLDTGGDFLTIKIKLGQYRGSWNIYIIIFTYKEMWLFSLFKKECRQ